MFHINFYSLLYSENCNISGSSYKSELESAIEKEKIEPLSVKNESSLSGHIITLDNSNGSLASKVYSGILTSTNASSSPVGLIPPLKPPPGRNMASPAVPPPPAPPPPFPQPKPGPPPPAPPPPLPKSKPGPPPPPSSKATTPPRPPQASSLKVPRRSPLGPNPSGDANVDADAPKTKLKPLFWDKVSTNPEKSMVWNEIKSGSFQ